MTISVRKQATMGTQRAADAKGGADALSDVERELAEFEAGERERLGLASERPQWYDANPNEFTFGQRTKTTILVAGLTHAHDAFARAGLASCGYDVQVLDCPDNNALRFGKEFGNRGQCNPTYFTVGNLIKYLTHLRDEKGMSAQQIIDGYLFLTAGACGPCRFGMYVTEYRKALRDSGFEGFRVLLVSQGGTVQSASGDGLILTKRGVARIFRGLIIGDVLNALMYRIRPYEIQAGATDQAVAECRAVVSEALERRQSLIVAVYRCRRILARVAVDRTRVKPRVAIIGEFWAMTTEGDGNYQIQRFLESEGAEVDIQVVTAWLLYLLWERRHDIERRTEQRGEDAVYRGIAGKNVRLERLVLRAADVAARAVFHTFARIMGLRDFHLPDMQEVCDLAAGHYDAHVRGGEGFMEVGKLIHNVVHNKVNMTLSVKPFGCMPSAGVSDGVQAIVTEMHPQAIFLPVETSGDAAVNAYSRVQMQLFKARQAAQAEVETALSRSRLSREDVVGFIGRHPAYNRSLHRSPHRAGCTAADLVYEVAAKMGNPAAPA
jgi:predicted nucleotide-binding protein (sugar kinase/HSP70/actin superfamily)